MATDTKETDDKNEVTAARILKASKGIIMPRANSTQEHLFWLFVVASSLAHVVFILASDLDWLSDRTPIMEEMAIDADLVGDFDLGNPPPITAIPDSIKADEAKAPDRMLPQLPKKFTVKEKDVEDEGIPEKIIEDTKQKEKDQAEQEKQKKLAIKRQEDEANKLNEEEIRKRAALELIRKNLDKEKQAKAEMDDPIARLKDEINKRNKTDNGVFASAGAKGEAKKYHGKLQRIIRRNYALPESYNLKNAKLRVVIRISVGENGNLMKMGVEKSSGDAMFDDLAIQAVKASTPLPKPPRGLVAQAILLNFTPQSF